MFDAPDFAAGVLDGSCDAGVCEADGATAPVTPEPEGADISEGFVTRTGVLPGTTPEGDGLLSGPAEVGAGACRLCRAARCVGCRVPCGETGEAACCGTCGDVCSGWPEVFGATCPAILLPILMIGAPICCRCARMYGTLAIAPTIIRQITTTAIRALWLRSSSGRDCPETHGEREKSSAVFRSGNDGGGPGRSRSTAAPTGSRSFVLCSCSASVCGGVC